METVFLELPYAFQRQVEKAWEDITAQLSSFLTTMESSPMAKPISDAVNAVILHKLNNPDTAYEDIDMYDIIRKVSEPDEWLYFNITLGLYNETLAYRIMYNGMEENAVSYAKRFLKDVMDINSMDLDIYKETRMLKTTFDDKILAKVYAKLRSYIVEDMLAVVDWTLLGDLIYENVNGFVAQVDASRGVIKAVLYPQNIQ